jgi:hypothetical protein
MNRNDLATVASEWLAAMPAKALAKPPVCVGAAQTFLKAGQWEKLREMTEQGGSWEDMDFTRRAFLARALERFEEPEKSALEWNKAVSAAQSREDGPYRMERLATLAGRWHWEQREEDLLWRIARSGRSPGWVLDSLWRKAAKRSNTAQLQEVAGFIAKTAPGDVTARNTYTFLCLLKRTQEGNPHHQSAVLYRDNPANPAVAVTYALSLYQQGKINEALAVTSAISLEELRKAESYAFYHAVFLIAAERGAEAEKFLEFVARRAVLPEEKAILQREKEFAAKRAEQAREKALGEPQKPGATVPQ